MKWTAEITNDPERNFDIYIEILENDENKGRLQFDENGKLHLTFYGPETAVIPISWLIELIRVMEEDYNIKVI